MRPPACKADALPAELSSDGRLTLPKGHIWVFSYSLDGPVISLFNHPGRELKTRTLTNAFGEHCATITPIPYTATVLQL